LGAGGLDILRRLLNDLLDGTGERTATLDRWFDHALGAKTPSDVFS
jgi:hypothetical protein